MVRISCVAVVVVAHVYLCSSSCGSSCVAVVVVPHDSRVVGVVGVVGVGGVVGVVGVLWD